VPSLSELPRDLGVSLVPAGVVGMILPGPGAPALMAGWLILWPDPKGKAEHWLRRRFPAVYHGGRKPVRRSLADLERRDPGSTRPPAGPSDGPRGAP
jgi:hypothetical protein